MRSRGRLAVLFVLVVLSLAGCGGDDGNGFGCTGQTCKATFQGPGEQDLSSKLGSGATVELITVDGDSVTGRIADRDVKLVKNETQTVARFKVTLTEVDGDEVTLRVVGS